MDEGVAQVHEHGDALTGFLSEGRAIEDGTDATAWGKFRDTASRADRTHPHAVGGAYGLRVPAHAERRDLGVPRTQLRRVAVRVRRLLPAADAADGAFAHPSRRERHRRRRRCGRTTNPTGEKAAWAGPARSKMALLQGRSDSWLPIMSRMGDHGMVGIIDWLSGRKASLPAPPIAFFVRLDEEDWGSDEGAWRCPALRIPTASVRELRSQSKSIPPEKYRVELDTHLIFWLGGETERPKTTIAVRIDVSQALVTSAQAELATKESSVRVAGISAIASILVAAITGTGTYYAAKAKSPSPRPDDVSPLRSKNDAAPQENIPFDGAQVASFFKGTSCVMSNGGLFAYCGPKSVDDCDREVRQVGGAFGAAHHCVASPKVAFCGAYRSAGAVRPVCYASQEQCDPGRMSYRALSSVDAISDSCRKIDITSS
jgi:hypothetical protein